ncbi:MAG: hypothetical protein ACI9MR_003734 [Myxococcota bacterium]|jgi:hypothetical protein
MRYPSIALGVAVLLLGSWSGCEDAADPSVADDTADVADTADPQDTVEATDTGLPDTLDADDTAGDDTAGDDTATADDTGADDTETPDTSPVSDTVPPEPTCSDGVINGDETGEDCGGGTCPQCLDGQGCLDDADCVSNYCKAATACVGDTETTIVAIQEGTGSVDCVNEVADLVTHPDVRIRAAVVTPVYSVSATLDGAYLGRQPPSPGHGIAVVWPKTLEVPDLESGAQVVVTGAVKEFYCNTQLAAESLVVLSPGTGSLVGLVSTPEVVQAEAWEGTVVSVSDVVVSDITTLDSGYLTVEGGLQVQLRDFGVTVPPGTERFASILGVMKYSFGGYRLAALSRNLPYDPCAAILDPCQNGAACSNVDDTAVCTCVAGYEGERCEVDIDNCTPNPCVEGACIDGVDAFTCACGTPLLTVAGDPFQTLGSGDTSMADSSDGHEPTACPQLGTDAIHTPSGNDEKWRFEAPTAGTYRVTVRPTGNADLFLYALTLFYPSATACPIDSSCYGHKDSMGDGGAEFLDLPDMTQGQRVTVIVDSWNAATQGAYDITIERLTCPDGVCPVVAAESGVSVLRMVVGKDGNPVFARMVAEADGDGMVVCDGPYCASGTNGLPGWSIWDGYTNGREVALAAPTAGGDGPAVVASTANLVAGGPRELTLHECTTAKCTARRERLVSDGKGECPQAVMYANGDVGVVHAGDGGLTLSTCVKGGPSCTHNPVGSEGRVCPVVRLDANEYPVMVFPTATGIRYIRCQNKACTGSVATTQFTLAVSLFDRPDFVLRPDGSPIIVFKTTNGTVRYIRCDDASCSSQRSGTVASAASSSPRVVVNGDARPIMVHYNTSNELQVLFCDPADCSGPSMQGFLLPAVGFSGLDIAVSADGVPMVSYYQGGTLKLMRLAIPPEL